MLGHEEKVVVFVKKCTIDIFLSAIRCALHPRRSSYPWTPFSHQQGNFQQATLQSHTPYSAMRNSRLTSCDWASIARALHISHKRGYHEIGTHLLTEVNPHSNPVHAPISINSSCSSACTQNPTKGSFSESCIMNRRMMIEEVASDALSLRLCLDALLLQGGR
jgi:hypothetical protein